MARWLIVLLAATTAACVAALLRARRRSSLPELNRHPERLDQMLDPTDDA